MELAALFWGGFFLTLVILSWVGVFLTWRGLKKHHIDPLDGVDSTPLPVTEGQEMSLSYRFTLPALPWPAVRLGLESLWTFTSGRQIRGQAQLGPGDNQGRLTLVPSRGVFHTRGPELVVSDWWGLARGRLEIPFPGKAVVLAGLLSEEPPELTPSGTGEHRSRSPRRQRNSELLEVRKYYPGDDLRRVNWHLYAHSGELFLRIGEENPPPEAQVCLVFDDSGTGLDLVTDIELSVLDRRISQFLGLCETLTSQGWGVVLALPGHHALLDWGKSPQECREALAPLRPSGTPQSLPPLFGYRGVLVTFPGSPLEASYREQVETQGLSCLALPLPPALPPSPPPSPWWKTTTSDHRRSLRDRALLIRRFQEVLS